MGKLRYARTLCGTNGPICDLSLEKPEKIFDAPLIVNLQDGVKSLLREGRSAFDFFDASLPRLRASILIGDEVGSGVVPLDPFERLWRDETGFLYQHLATHADIVDRVWSGLPMRLKG